MTVSKLGATIKDARKAKGLTQEALAKEMHVSTGTISKWESGSNTPDIFKMQKLAQILDIPSTIFTDENYDLRSSEVTPPDTSENNYSEPIDASSTFFVSKKKRFFLTSFILLGILALTTSLVVFFYHLHSSKPYKIVDTYYSSDYADYNKVYCIEIICNSELTLDDAMLYSSELEKQYSDYYNSADAIIVKYYSSKDLYKAGQYDYLTTLHPPIE